MHLIVAAVASLAAALAEFTLGPYLNINGATPHFVLVFGVIWTLTAGLEGGLVWAFVGGLALDVIVQRPMGSTAFAMIVSVGLASVIGGALTRAKILAPIAATFACSLLYSMLLLVTTVALQGPVGLPDPVRSFLPSAVYDTVIAAVVGSIAVSFVARRREAERTEW